MKKIASFLFILSLAVTAWAQNPSLAGEYHLLNKQTVKEDIRFPLILNIRDDNTATLLYSLRTSGVDAYGKEVLQWRVEKNILFLNDSGYYISWSKNKWGDWVLCLTPAFDSKEKVYGVREGGK